MNSEVKIDKDIRTKTILEDVPKLWTNSDFQKSYWLSQKELAPGHKAEAIQDWCAAYFPDLLSTMIGRWTRQSWIQHAIPYDLLRRIKRAL